MVSSRITKTGSLLKMVESSDKGQGKKKITKVKTFSVPFALEKIKENIILNTNTPSKSSKEQIINQAFKFHSQGNISEAVKYYKQLINQGFNDHRVFSNYGLILQGLGKLQDAELSCRKAIEINPNFTQAHSNLGNILKDLGQLQEAELSYRKAIELNPNFAEAHLNLGTILKDLGKLQDAELSCRKAIEIKPNFADAHLNLGTILKDLGKLQDAELSYQKAIEIKPDYAMAQSNLGNILRDFGKLKEAELSYRKAIAIEPDYAMAQSNLGNILKDLGKLKEAELSYRKAIKIKPDFADAHLNLGIILLDLGKLQELILFSKSTLKLQSINKGYKLLASLRITIANLLLQEFPETLLSINKTNDLINQGAINTIEDAKNRKHLLTFSRFISSLYPLLDKENQHPDTKKIPHLGESHCLSFAHQTLSISSQLKRIQPVLITGGKAWHFANKKNNQWKDSLTQQIKNHAYSDNVMISFGEIDCRKDEGILNYAIKNDKDISKVCEQSIKGYLDYMEEILTPNYSKKYYFGVPAPTRGKEFLDDLDIKRIKMIQIYNSILKKEVLSRGSYFLDVYKLTSNNEGVNNNMHMCDYTHLSPKCLSILFENYLYKS